MNKKHLTGVEVSFDKDRYIVSKTDMRGIIQYANKTFLEVSGFKEKELIGKPHNILRHPDMPKCIFKLWWDHLNDGKEIFAYVVNRCKNGDHYWVFGHGTPSIDADGNTVGLHSDRRVPKKDIIKNKVVPLYAELLKIEQESDNSEAGMNNAYAHFSKLLEPFGGDYNAWDFSL